MSAWSTLKQQLGDKRGLRWSTATALTAAMALLATTAGNAAPGNPPDRVRGWRTQMGNGDIVSYADLHPNGAPKTVGISISAAALNSMPSEPSDLHHCFDRNSDGVTTHASECAPTHEFVIPLPDAVSQRTDVPFKWVLLNWNKQGHMPPGIYDVAHLDVHFYLVPIEDVFAIHDGPCGPELVNCDDFATAKQPLPEGKMHPDFKDVDAVAPAMGNHLIDVGGHEFHGMPFTSSWIYGVYGGRVTFWEQMVSLAYLHSRPNACAAIKTPPSVAVAGHYPTQQCIRYDAATDSYTVSLEGFAYRDAS